MLKGNRKTIALITTCRLVDSETRGVNSSKAQYEKAIGKSNMQVLSSFRDLPMYNFGLLVFI